MEYRVFPKGRRRYCLWFCKYTDTYERESRFYIKRIAAKEKDIITYVPISLIEGNLFVNNTYVEKIRRTEYNVMLSSLEYSYTLKFSVPKDKILVLGDNREPGGSRDSRAFGFIDEEEVIGKVLFRFYPFTKIGNPSPEYR